MSESLLVMMLALFTIAVYLSTSVPVIGIWRRLTLKDKILCAFLLILSALVVIDYVYSNSFLTRSLFSHGGFD